MADIDTLDHGGDGEVADDAAAEELSEVEAMAEAIAIEDERRKWVRTLSSLIEKEVAGEHLDEQVGHAWNLTRIAAFDAIRRVLSGVMPGEVPLD